MAEIMAEKMADDDFPASDEFSIQRATVGHPAREPDASLTQPSGPYRVDATVLGHPGPDQVARPDRPQSRPPCRRRHHAATGAGAMACAGLPNERRGPLLHVYEHAEPVAVQEQSGRLVDTKPRDMAAAPLVGHLCQP